MGVQQSKEELLYQQVSNGDIEGIKNLHREGAKLEWVDRERKTPLILASMKTEALPVAKVLIELGANVNAYRPGLHAGTPLHHAARRGLEQTVLLLLSHGGLLLLYTSFGFNSTRNCIFILHALSFLFSFSGIPCFPSNKRVLLIKCSANALKINDANQTPLDIARAKRRCNIVRAIEKHISVFSGCLRELYGPRFLEALVPQLLSRKIWAVIVPCDHHNPTKPFKFELAIYPDLQVSHPRTTIKLWMAKIEKLDINQLEPVVVIFDKNTKARHKFLPANEGDKEQLLWFYHACSGMPQYQVYPVPTLPESMPMPNPASAVANPCVWATPASASAVPNPYVWPTPASASAVPNHCVWPTPASASVVPKPYVWATPATSSAVPTTALPNAYISATSAPAAASEDAELAMAISASIQSAIAEGLSPLISHLPVNMTGNPHDQDKTEKTVQSSCCPTYEASSSTGPSNGFSAKQSVGQHVPAHDTANQNQIVAPVILSSAHNPSAPPAIEAMFSNGVVHYPSINSSPIDLPNPHNGVKSGKDAEKESGDTTGTCVICLDAAVEGACVPCGHMAGCMSCLDGIKAKGWGCPVCRAKIEQVIKLFSV